MFVRSAVLLFLILGTTSVFAWSGENYRCELYCEGQDPATTQEPCARCGLPLRPASFFERKLRLGKTAAILLFPGVQVIDFAGPFEVLGAGGVRVHTVGTTTEALRTDEGLIVTPEFTLTDCPPMDLLVLPGGKIYADREIAAWIEERSRDTELILSVCNGLSWLSQAGLLDGLEVTTTATTVARLLDSTNPRYRVDRRVEEAGSILTAGGYTSGIDGALQVIARWKGTGAAKLLAAKLEYDWKPEQGAFPRYRAYYLQLRSLAKSLARTIPWLDGERIVDANIGPHEASQTWEITPGQASDTGDEPWSEDQWKDALAEFAGSQWSAEKGRLRIEWSLGDANDDSWMARCELVLDPENDAGKLTLEVFEETGQE